jgi:hypothetical protein
MAQMATGIVDARGMPGTTSALLQHRALLAGLTIGSMVDTTLLVTKCPDLSKIRQQGLVHLAQVVESLPTNLLAPPAGSTANRRPQSPVSVD